MKRRIRVKGSEPPKQPLYNKAVTTSAGPSISKKRIRLDLERGFNICAQTLIATADEPMKLNVVIKPKDRDLWETLTQFLTLSKAEQQNGPLIVMVYKNRERYIAWGNYHNEVNYAENTYTTVTGIRQQRAPTIAYTEELIELLLVE